jgi:hypothetical protein
MSIPARRDSRIADDASLASGTSENADRDVTSHTSERNQRNADRLVSNILK